MAALMPEYHPIIQIGFGLIGLDGRCSVLNSLLMVKHGDNKPAAKKSLMENFDVED